MKYLLIDDEELALWDLKEVLEEVDADCDLSCYTSPSRGLKDARINAYDIAFLDIEMGAADGITFACQLKELQPRLHIIFVTSHEKYAVDAFAIHATGYLLKPVAKEDVERELTFLYWERQRNSHIQVKTFGGFDVIVDGRPLAFRRAKSKEFLAYLVDRRGSSVTLREAADILFEDGIYDGNRRRYMLTIYASLKRTLEEAGAGQMLMKQFNCYAVKPDTFECDGYRFLDGDPIAINNYRKDYMLPYSWAEFSLGTVESSSGRRS